MQRLYFVKLACGTNFLLFGPSGRGKERVKECLSSCLESYSFAPNLTCDPLVRYFGGGPLITWTRSPGRMYFS